MQTSIKLGIVVVVVLAIGGAAYALLAPDTSLIPSSSVRDVSVSQVIDAPRDFSDREIEIEGDLIKSPLMAGMPFFLSDGDSLLLLRSSDDLDKYLGLTLRVGGVVNYDPQAVGRPSTSLRVEELEVIEGEPRLFIEVSKDGVDVNGRPFSSRFLMLQNDGTLLLFNIAGQMILFDGSLSDEEMEKVTQTIVENGFFEMKTEIYPEADERLTGRVVFTYRLKVILWMDGEIKVNEITWIQPSVIPDNLVAIEEVINQDLLGIIGEVGIGEVGLGGGEGDVPGGGM